MTQQHRRRIEQSLGETINIIARYAAKDAYYLQWTGEGEILSRYEQHRDKLLAMLHEAA